MRHKEDQATKRHKRHITNELEDNEHTKLPIERLSIKDTFCAFLWLRIKAASLKLVQKDRPF